MSSPFLTELTAFANSIRNVIGRRSDMDVNGDKSSIVAGINSLKTFLLGEIGASKIYDVGSFCPGRQTAYTIIMFHVFARSVIFPVNLTGSRGESVIQATSQVEYTIKKVSGTTESTIGFMRFGAASKYATFTMQNQQTFLPGDTIKIVSPATADSTLSDVTVLLSGLR